MDISTNVFNTCFLWLIKVYIFKSALVTKTLSSSMLPDIYRDSYNPLESTADHDMNYQGEPKVSSDYMINALLNLHLLSQTYPNDARRIRQFKGFKTFKIDKKDVGGSTNVINEAEGSGNAAMQIGDSVSRWTRKRFFPPTVAVLIERPVGHQQGYGILVPVAPDMTFLTSLIYATRRFQLTNGDTVENPFNVSIDWDNSLDCYVVVNAAGVDNRSRRKWFITVFTSVQQMVYRSRCLPALTDVSIRPDTQIVLSFER